ncbi:reducing type I polyketide synthase [Mytilinidion resinicola]|uniref:Reducing type I polyketide synthase n=1 Tax=Mytilinidion resinicola TaxID=574789 RepID=A0A6A6YQV6_9PEZI|nr:reducing type I polyketide synthase [Mytilinidion resinicola]KAF2811141.1 reducing type I polyketide synthase [Mytilinidion resinicola]
MYPPVHANDYGKQDATEPIAIVGFSFKFPGGCETADSFWEALLEKRNTATVFPKDRLSASAMYHPQLNRRGTIPFQGGHFLTSNIAEFDAPFFSISDAEAASLDPQQRILLETTFRALENAGQPLNRVIGSKTSVFTGCFTNDWQQLCLKDAEQCTSHAGIGFEASILANRLSWFFNFKGTSFNVDSACSSSLVCVDLAVKNLTSGDSDMSIAAGCNLLFYPDIMHALSNLGLLSPNNQCYSFDDRANGYARGEGFGVLVLKRLSDAIEHNDVIRAVIRSTGSNQDGYTTGLTQPSSKAQSELIRETYRRARLDLDQTRFIEAHGTGTAVGDPIEGNAIGEVFRRSRSSDDPLYVGAVKSNIGHLEGSSGIAGVIKSILALEKGVIPPNTNFVNINPQIDPDFLRIKFPLQPTKWPSKGLRRASVNSFGFGGTNAHVILDDALHYLQSRRLVGHHNTIDYPEDDDAKEPFVNGTAITTNGDTLSYDALEGLGHPPKLIVLSAMDKDTLETQAKAHTQYIQSMLKRNPVSDSFVSNFAYTTSARRNPFPWKSFAVVETLDDLAHLKSHLSSPRRSISEPSLCVVFTGQGAQYPGRELLCLEQFEVYRQSLTQAEHYLQKLGCRWKLREELYKDEKLSKINDAEYSQPISTAVQVALVDTLRSFNIYPNVVIGHSSGEISAAYCAGALSAESAWKLAYFRGYHSALLSESGKMRGGMVAAGLSEEDVLVYLDRVIEQTGERMLTVACINSPKSVTISGRIDHIDLLETMLSESNVFARKLNVNLPYHSHFMNAASQQYLESIIGLEKGVATPHPITMISTVTGKWIHDRILRTPQYWVDNMICPVKFAPAVQALTFQAGAMIWKKLDCSHRNRSKVTFLLEVGFHSALRGPLRDIVGGFHSNSKIAYESVLVRDKAPLHSLFNSLGHLYCHGYPLDLSGIYRLGQESFGLPKPLCDLPEYPFNHSRRYWTEGRVSRRLRLHHQEKLDLLGKPSPDWNDVEAKWRNFIRVSEMPWVEDHKINGATIYPAAGMLVMAIEAANQTTDKSRTVEGFEMKDIRFLSALTIPSHLDGVETHIYLRQVRDSANSETPWSEFRVFSFDSDEWHENCRGSIRVTYKAIAEGFSAVKESIEELNLCRQRHYGLPDPIQDSFDHRKLYNALRSNGFDFGPSFQLLRNGSFPSDKEGKADIEIFEWAADTFPQPHIIHPCTLDAILHLSLAACAKGGDVQTPTAVPSSLKRLWIASQGLNRPGPRTTSAAAWMVGKDARGTEFNISVLDDSKERVLAQVTGLRSTIVAEMSESSQDNADVKQTCYHLDWKPDVALLSSQKLLDYCVEARPKDLEPAKFYQDLDFLLLAFLTKAVDELQDHDFPTTPPHLSRYYQWAKLQLQRYQEDLLPNIEPEWARIFEDSEAMERLCEQIQSTNAEGQAYVATGRHLTSILRGDTDPLEFLFHNDLLTNFYREINDSRACFAELSRVLDAAAHKNPNMKVLEVGAGTGGTTEKVLSTLSTQTDSAMRKPRYSSYFYTDISSAFFEAAEARFIQYPNIEYQALNIEIDPSYQGLDCGTFDMVVAANVLHATPDISLALRNVRKLLNPGGLLVLYEPTRPEIMRPAFIMGLLPGWWLSSEDYRPWGPTMTSASWDKILRDNCFSGVDLEMPDFLAPECQEGSIMISTATSTVCNMGPGITTEPPSHGAPILVLNLESEFQRDVACRLLLMLPSLCRSASFAEIAQIDDMASSYFIFIEEIERPFLMNLSKEMYSIFQKVAASAKGILWVTNGGGTAPKQPESGVANGLFRVLRNENPDRPCATLALDLDSAITDEQLEAICQIFRLVQQENFDQSTQDMEYVEIDGVLQIPRVVQAEKLTENLFSRSLPRQTSSRMVEDCPPLQLAIGSVGFLDTLHFTEDDDHPRPLDPDEVEVEVRAMGLNFRDCFLALGRIPDSSYGSECSGLVSQTGCNVVGLSTGDRVVMSASPCFKTYARGKASHVLRIADEMTFAEAASIPTQFCTAWQAVHGIARLQRGESILIHAGAGGTGQAAIQVAQYVGGIIYATVSSEMKRDVLVEQYGIPEDHIFFSRDSSFAKGVMRKTKGRGVDVVLNSLAGDSLIASWECIAPYGRFVELGKRDILSNANLPMYPFKNNASFICFDGFKWQTERPQDSRRAFEEVLQLFSAGEFRPIRSLNVYPATKVEEAFRAMQDGKTAGKIVLEVTPTTPVKAILATQPSFLIGHDATYVIAGGLGGLGRSVARWLVDRGARNLILLSRSGIRNETARDFVEELKQQDVLVKAPACDITDAAVLEEVIQQCTQEMPPIRGCFQGSMVLRDFMFDKMDHADWHLGTDCKTIGSWNLHQLLPKDLHFFIFLSSASSVVGLRGQANYAAGNSYMDALARYRVSRGERAVSLDLGALTEDGLLAENPEFLNRVLGYGALNGISRNFFYAILDYYCDPALPLLSPTQSQPVIGLGSDASGGLDGIVISRQAIFTHLKENAKSRSAGEKNDDGAPDAWKERFHTANSQIDAAHVVEQALVAKLQRTLAGLHGEVDMYKPVAAYGVDSLLAVELRSWIAKEFKADVAMFEISGGASFSTLSKLVVERSKMKRG